jgi:hypothetical protein
MKKIILSTLALTMSLVINAQNVNVKSEEKTVITTIKDSDGERKIVKTVETNEEQKVTLGEEKPNSINIPTTISPVDVTETTKVSVNGNVKSVDVDHSAYYSLNGEKYQVKSEKSGYTVTSSKNRNSGVLRRTSNNNYMYINNKKVSYAYYDNDGNLVIETYNPKTDSMEMEKFEVIK